MPQSDRDRCGQAACVDGSNAKDADSEHCLPSEEERAERRAIHRAAGRYRQEPLRRVFTTTEEAPVPMCSSHLISSSASTGVWYFVYWLEGEIIKL